jgi:hypothetical protein
MQLAEFECAQQQELDTMLLEELEALKADKASGVLDKDELQEAIAQKNIALAALEVEVEFGAGFSEGLLVVCEHFDGVFVAGGVVGTETGQLCVVEGMGGRRGVGSCLER